MPLSPADQLHINIEHGLRQNYRRFLTHHSAPAPVMPTCITLDALALLTPRDRRHLPHTGEQMDAWNTLGFNK